MKSYKMLHNDIMHSKTKRILKHRKHTPWASKSVTPSIIFLDVSMASFNISSGISVGSFTLAPHIFCHSFNSSPIILYYGRPLLIFNSKQTQLQTDPAASRWQIWCVFTVLLYITTKHMIILNLDVSKNTCELWCRAAKIISTVSDFELWSATCTAGLLKWSDWSSLNSRSDRKTPILLLNEISSFW